MRLRTPEDHHAAGDGVRDDTASLQQALAAAVADGEPLGLRARPYRVRGTLFVEAVSGFGLLGAGASDFVGGSRLVWDGDPDRPLLCLRDVSRGRFLDFALTAGPARPLAVAVQCENGAAANPSPHENVFERLVVNGTAPAGLTRAGFYLPKGAGGDANNDYGTFRNIEVVNFGGCGFLFMHSQCKANRLEQCLIRGYGGQIGVSVGYDPTTGEVCVGGSVNWTGGGASGHTRADVYLANPTDASAFVALNCESSARFLDTGGPSGILAPITVDTVRWAHAGKLAADGYWLRCRTPGPLTVRGSHIQDHATFNPQRILFGPGGAAPGTLLLEANVLESTAADPVEVAGTGLARVYRRGNLGRNRQTGALFALPDGGPA